MIALLPIDEGILAIRPIRSFRHLVWLAMKLNATLHSQKTLLEPVALAMIAQTTLPPTELPLYASYLQSQRV